MPKHAFQNHIKGTITDAIGDEDTAIFSEQFEDLYEVDSSYEEWRMSVVLDPLGTNGPPEIVYVTDHAWNSSEATVERGMDDTIPRAHPAGTPWIHTITADVLSEMRDAVGSGGGGGGAGGVLVFADLDGPNADLLPDPIPDSWIIQEPPTAPANINVAGIRHVLFAEWNPGYAGSYKWQPSTAYNMFDFYALPIDDPAPTSGKRGRHIWFVVMSPGTSGATPPDLSSLPATTIATGPGDGAIVDGTCMSVPFLYTDGYSDYTTPANPLIGVPITELSGAAPGQQVTFSVRTNFVGSSYPSIFIDMEAATANPSNLPQLLPVSMGMRNLMRQRAVAAQPEIGMAETMGDLIALSSNMAGERLSVITNTGMALLLPLPIGDGPVTLRYDGAEWMC